MEFLSADLESGVRVRTGATPRGRRDAARRRDHRPLIVQYRRRLCRRIGGPVSTTCPAGSSLQVPNGGSKQAQCVITSTGTPVGAVKHVWLIILENKSYDETFTGLNQNSYLWQTLPQQGALLTNYYGTGHFSMDNYISLVSGQSPSYAVQDDCSTAANMTNNNSGIITTGTVGTGTDTDQTADGQGTNTNTPNPTGAGNGNYGQLLVHGGVDAALSSNGCVYPTDVADNVQPVQRGRRLMEGLRPGPRWRPARRDPRPT